jgi:Sulfotransferase domain
LNKIIAMWAHQRSMSTAFLRMMIERGDITVIHEPLVTLLDEDEVPVTDGRGGQVILRSEKALFDHMRELACERPVFFKDTVEHRYSYLFEHPDAVADIEHTFIVREPRQTISSMYHMKPTITCPEIGYEHLHEIFELASQFKGGTPTVINADHLVRDPRSVVQRFCKQVNIAFIEKALSWQSADRPEWGRTRKWHMDVINSSGFAPTNRQYTATVENTPLLAGFLEHHKPFYEQLVRHAI